MSRQPSNEQSCACANRRRFVLGLAIGLPAAVTARLAGAFDECCDFRTLRLINTHTGEEREVRYFEGGTYRPEQLGTLDWLLRDYRTGQVFPIEPRLFDLLHELAAEAGREPRYEVISGYRSPATNAMLAATTGGVSSQSLHMSGRAIDVRLVNFPTAGFRDLALAKQAGGVGYYPGSDFVHLDTGRVRSWSG